MKPSVFGYQAPTTLEDAISLLAGDADAVVLAGGQTLLPAMNDEQGGCRSFNRNPVALGRTSAIPS